MRSVTFQVVKPDSTLRPGPGGNTLFPLYDDGLRIDVNDSDGIFSGDVILDSLDPVGTYTLKFTAKDSSGAVSDTVTNTLEVVP